MTALWRFGAPERAEAGVRREFITEDVRHATKEADVDEWLMAVRQNHLAALRTGRDAMMEYQAARFERGIGFGASCS